MNDCLLFIRVKGGNAVIITGTSFFERLAEMIKILLAFFI